MKNYEIQYYKGLWDKNVTSSDIAEKYLPKDVVLKHFIGLDIFKEYCLEHEICFKRITLKWETFTNKYADIWLIHNSTGWIYYCDKWIDMSYNIFFRYILNDKENMFFKECVPFSEVVSEYRKDLYKKAREVLDTLEIDDLESFITDYSDTDENE